MNRRPTVIIAAVLAAVLLGLQFLSPIFKGDADLTLPERIRHAFVDLFGGKKEEELPEFIELEEQPENGVELPMQTLNNGDEVELPEGDTAELPQGGIAVLPEDGTADVPEGGMAEPPEFDEENELPMDVFH